MAFDAGCDQTHDLFLELLPVTGTLLVPDYQVDAEALESPIGVGPHQLAHQLDVRQFADLEQDDRQVAGDRETP